MKRPYSAARFGKLILGLSALGIGFGGARLEATPEDGRVAIDGMLASLASQTGTAVKTTLTATSTDLATAISALLVNGTALSPADLAAGALVKVNVLGVDKVRADRDKVAPLVVAAAIGSSDPSDNSIVAAVVGAVVAVNEPTPLPSVTSTTELTRAGRSAAVSAALAAATNSSAGSSIAATVLPYVQTDTSLPGGNGNEAFLKSFSIEAIKAVGTNTVAVKSFMDGLLTTMSADNVERNTFGFAVAEAVKANGSAAGEVVGSIAANLPDTLIAKLAADAINFHPLLAKAIPEVVGSITLEYNGNRSDLARELIKKLATTNKTVAIKGLVTAGVIWAGDSNNSETLDIVTEVLSEGALLTDAERITFASNAVTANGRNATDLTLNAAKAGTVAGYIATLIVDPKKKGDLGKAMIKVVAISNPDGAGAITGKILESASATDAVTITALSKILIAGAPTNILAAGSVAAAAATHLPAGLTTADDDEAKATLSAALIVSAPKAVGGIAWKVSALSSDPAVFAPILALKSTKNAALIAAGSAYPVPADAPTVAKNVILAQTATGTNPFLAQAAVIAGKVAIAVDVEKAADIGAVLSSAMTVTGVKDLNGPHLKLSQAAGIATSIAVGINTKPKTMASFLDNKLKTPNYNRADELGELAATIVGGVLGKSNTALDELNLISAIGKAVIGALSKKATFNGLYDAADVSNAADIAGSIAQTISYSSLITDAQKQYLIGTSANASLGIYSALEKALLGAVKSAVFKAQIQQAFAEVRNAGLGNLVAGFEKLGTDGISAADAVLVGKYEIGSVNDPETPVSNG